MSSIKDPEKEAQIPARMPPDQQGRGGSPKDTDPQGQQGAVHHQTRMAPHADAPAGLEQDSHGKTIPLSQRTQDDQEKARSGKI